MTFREAYEKFMHRYETVEPAEISFIIWFVENPMSPFCLHGSAALRDHDAIHVLLECDQTNNSEAFVIGFTMGNDDRTKTWEVKLFKFISRFLYPKKNKFTKKQINIFERGFAYGRTRNFKRIGEVNWTKEDWNSSLKEMQLRFGIHDNELSYYKETDYETIISVS
jgi:hypothetical protein